MALLFIVTSAGLSVLVVWQLATQNNDQSADASQQISDNSNKSKLQGTELKNFDPVSQVPKLQIIDTKTGTGSAVKASDTVTVNYTGAVAATGKIFQSSLDTGQPATFPLNGVIKGWEKGLPGMKVGGERRLLIPAAQAYGANPPQGSGIPANANLVFDITLLKIDKK
jgi:FKBP-type peptidyl-prolyl cis-trans isomerase